MPTICEFNGIFISIHYNEHQPPHFHAEYGDYEVAIEIQTLKIVKGDFPPQALKKVIKWATIHQKKLLEGWNNANNHKPLEKIPPLA